MLEQATGLFHHRGSHFWRELGKAAPLFGCIQHAIKSQPLVEELIEGLAGEHVVDPGLAAAALSEGETPLTPREHDVLVAARQHPTVAEIAGAVFLAPGTVRNYLSSAMQKLGAQTRAEAVRLAEEKGWL